MAEAPGRPLQLHAVVRGWVQGVGFRDFTQRKAKSLGLSGWVRNTPGGEVEVLAEGSRDALEALAETLAEAFPGASVSAVELTWGAAKGGLAGFEVRR